MYHWKATDDGNGIGLTHSCAPVLFKDSYWSFQDEIRYYLIANYKYEDRNELPEYFDIPINESALKSLKIRLYPNCNDEDAKTVEKIIANNLITQDSIEITERSCLDGKYQPKN